MTALGTVPVGVEVRLRAPRELGVTVLTGDFDFPLELTSDPAAPVPVLHDGGPRNQEAVVLGELARWLRDAADYIEEEAFQ